MKKKVQEIKESSKYYKTAKPGSLAEKAEWLPSIMRRILRMAARRISVYRAD